MRDAVSSNVGGCISRGQKPPTAPQHPAPTPASHTGEDGTLIPLLFPPKSPVGRDVGRAAEARTALSLESSNPQLGSGLKGSAALCWVLEGDLRLPTD